MLNITTKGDFSNMEAFLKKILKGQIYTVLERYGQEGVMALERATPKDSGLTAGSWSYEIKKDRSSYSIIWGNNHVVDGRQIAVLLQFGHGTRNGGYVQGRDYINPALQPIFDQIANNVWKEVTSS